MSDTNIVDAVFRDYDEDYSPFVRDRKKAPKAIIEHLDESHADLIHMVMGIVGEAGELLDAVKKHTMYGQPLNVENVVEELGDLEYYMEGFRQAIGWTRRDILDANVAKLSQRYPKSYSDADAKARRDKRRAKQ
jgi:NTP pyrophosphatase (non-canonical NTP hydrolase)